GVAALPRAQEHPAHGQIHRNSARSLQELLALTAVGAGKLGVASPSITLAFAPASRCASISFISSIPRSICSVVIALTPPECSTCNSRGTSSAQTFKYAWRKQIVSRSLLRQDVIRVMRISLAVRLRWV